ncbi:MAG TPA: Ig-like domain-containing protein [Candidatus Saccharimonadales bacterium]
MGLYLHRKQTAKVRSLALVLGMLLFVSAPVYGMLSHVASALTTGLAAPVLTSPANNAVVNGATLTNSWQPVTGAVKYEYQSYNDAAASQLRFASTYTTTSKTATSVADGTVFWWRVRAVDATGTTSNWSDLWKVTIDNTAPSVPKNGTPNNSSLDTNDFYFNWDASTDANPVTYLFQSSLNPAVDANGVLTTGVWKSGTLPTPQIHSVGAPNGTWYWQVRAVDVAGNMSAWSPLWKMTITPDTTGPTVQITNPIAGYVKGVVTISGTVTDSHPDHYYLVVKDATGKVVAGPGTVNQKQVQDWQWDTTKLPDGVYTIDLEARDALGNKGPQSTQTLNVTVDNTIPTAAIKLTSTATPSASTDMVFAGTITTSKVAALKQLELWIDSKDYGDITKVVDVTGNWNYTLVGGLDKGDHKVAVVATDLAGNVSVETIDSYVAVTVSGYVVPPTEGKGIIATSIAPAPLPQVVTPVQPTRYYVASVQPTRDTGNTANTVTPPTSNTTNDKAVLGAESEKSPATLSASTVQPIAPSSSGWTLFGIAWYWWLLLLALMIGVGSWAKVAMNRRHETA